MHVSRRIPTISIPLFLYDIFTLLCSLVSSSLLYLSLRATHAMPVSCSTSHPPLSCLILACHGASVISPTLPPVLYKSSLPNGPSTRHLASALKNLNFSSAATPRSLTIDTAEFLAKAFHKMLISWTGFKCIMQAKKRDKQQHRANTFPKNPWFDKECKIEKKRVNKANKIFQFSAPAHRSGNTVRM